MDASDVEVARSADFQTDRASDHSEEIQPTEEESSTLEHLADQIPLAAWFIIIFEFCERFAFYGLTAPFQNYIQYPIPGPGDTQPGALDRGQRTATALTTFFQFLSFLTPILGAILADQLYGKYKMMLISCVIYAIGHALLILTSIPLSIDNGVAFPGLIVGLIIVGFGTGGIKSNVSPLMGEQYTRANSIVRVVKGKKVIIDPKVTLQSMFNWFYWSVNIGALSSIITTNVEKYYSFWLAFFIPFLLFSGAMGILIAGRNKYVRKSPSGSLLVRSFRITIAAFRIRWRLGPNPNHTHILDYAKEDSSSSSNHNQFVDELKQAWNACRVFAFYPFYWICYNQLATNMVSQAGQMNVGVLPNDVLQNIDPIILIFAIPLFEKVIYPSLRKRNIDFHSILRITCGFMCISLSMGWTALVQHLIYTTGPNYDYSIKPCDGCQRYNNITAAWQVPSYFFIALSEIFASITGLEYAFTQAPSSMKSVVMSIFLFMSAIGSALNFALVPVTENPKLMWMYTSLSIVSFLIGVLFFFLFRNSASNRKTATKN